MLVAEKSWDAIKEIFVDDIEPELKAFLTIFDPLEAKALLQDLLSAVPVALTGNVEAAAVEVSTEIGVQTIANAKTAVGSVLAAQQASQAAASTTPVAAAAPAEAPVTAPEASA